MSLLKIGVGAWIALAANAFGAEAGRSTDCTFERVQLSPEFFAEGAAAGDLNGDGSIDLVAGPYWYAGPRFVERHEIYPPKAFDINGYSDNFVAQVVDLNGDGRLDVAVVGFPGAEAFWYENPGNKAGHWKRTLLFPVVDNESPTFADVDGDGRLDLVCMTNGQVGYATADPDDATKPWGFHPVSPQRDYQKFTHGLGTGDVDGDGLVDILETSGWWQHPKGQVEGAVWTLHETRFGENGGAQIYAFDVDGDGDNDVVSSLNAHAYGMSWYEQTRQADKIEFTPHRIMGETAADSPCSVTFSEPHAIETPDVDGDGVRDIVTGKRWWAHSEHDPGALDPAVLYWFRTVRSRDGVKFVPRLIDANSGVGTQFVVADVDGDGQKDIFTSSKKGIFLHRQRVRDPISDKSTSALKASDSTGKGASSEPAGTGASEAVPSPNSAPPAATSSAEFMPTSPEGKTLNLDLEQGNLSDWKPSGDAFNGQPIWSDVVNRRRPDSVSGHVGDHWIGTFERLGDKPQGTLTSAPFRLDHPFISFYVGGGSSPETRVEIVDEETGKALVQASGHDAEQMRPLSFDLKSSLGRNLFVRIVDASSGPWGHVNFDHFRLHDAKPQISAMEARILTVDAYPYAGLSAEQAAAAMKLPPGFAATVFAAEPDVKQPIAMALDDRGRVWIAEAYEYPRRAPEGQGHDRILIFADTNGDGRFDERKVFAEGLNLVSGLEVGFGGVWVGAAPYLMFIADRNGDDVPDGKPEILLDGWGYQDTHETLNAFIWGPDGWLYGCHGVFTHSLVGKPGAPASERTPLNAAIWRYHPTRHTFETFANGTSNPWGVDFTDHGEAVCTACVIPHLFHMIKGARYHRQAGTHFNPYTFDDIKTIADHRHYLGDTPHSGNNKSDDAGGGHAHAGAMIYQGGAWPDEYRGQIFMNNIHGQRLNVDLLEPQGSGLVGRHGDDFLLTQDRASQMLNFRYGPDGQVYIIDWYDMQACHDGNADVHDRSNGRIYRVVYNEAKPISVDLARRSDAELAEETLNSNEWYVRHARRILQERAGEGPLDSECIAKLELIARTHDDDGRRLRAAWVLHATENLTSDLLAEMSRDRSPYVRGWSIQLALDQTENDLESLLPRLVELAKSDPSPVVRQYVASAAIDLPPKMRWEVVEVLLGHSEDAADHNLPLLYWYAAEPLAEVDPARTLALALHNRAAMPTVCDFMIRRLGAIDSPEVREEIVAAAGGVADQDSQLALLAGLRLALKGRSAVEEPKQWDATFAKLAKAPDARVRLEATALGVVFHDEASAAIFRTLATDQHANAKERREAVDALLEAGDSGFVPVLFELLRDSQLRAVALVGLARFNSAETPAQILSAYASLPSHERRLAIATLVSRPAYGLALLDAIGSGTVPRADLSAELATQLVNLKDSAVAAKLTEVWGALRTSNEEKQAQIEKYRQLVLGTSPAAADPILGRAVFGRTCQACHTLYGVGNSIGPDLTGSNRADLDYLLGNIVDPSAVITKEYQATIVLNGDGRVFSGIVSAEDDHTLTLRNSTETIVVPKDEVEDRSLSELSLMPENQLQQFTDEECVSLFAYLRGKEQAPLMATVDGAPPLFDGKTLAGWNGNKDLWSVENGEIIGRTTTGLAKNEFLVSDLAADDFELSLEVKLIDDAGNSGIQFRSRLTDAGDVAGYQADVGVGWWGKLYEEHGRELLWEKSDENSVRKGGWNKYVVRAVGSKIQTWINGQRCVDLNDPHGRRRGIFALQLHAGGPTEVRFRNIGLQPILAKASE